MVERQLPKLVFAGSIPVSRSKNNRGVAQMVARLVRDQEVVGSNPVTPTKKIAGTFMCPLFFVYM